ncbi:MAG: hypothetical protein ACXABF_14460 [Candidatus Thorarchaeota archaeon]|jgi:ABC-type uncharacterized transport system permease subunit
MMNDDTLKKTAITFIVIDLAILVLLFALIVQAFLSESYPETAFLIGVSFVLVAQLVFFFERAFTPDEIWWTKDAFKVRLIGEEPPDEESNAEE